MELNLMSYRMKNIPYFGIIREILSIFRERLSSAISHPNDRSGISNIASKITFYGFSQNLIELDGMSKFA